jgi:hypothetical protein
MLEQEEKKEILDAIQGLSNRMDGFEVGQQEAHEMIKEFSTNVDQRFDRVEGRLDRLEGKVGQMGASMVTKDYLDDKLAEHGSRYGEQIRKTNGKIEILTDSLVAEKSLSAKAAKRVTTAEPFARMK